MLKTHNQLSFLNDNASFQQKLLRWYQSSKRDLPWRNSNDPYKIWLSEIILQQTRVAQGLPYYQEFTNKFPTIHDLAAASEEEVLRTWQGLGYYSRARNLHKCARIVSNVLNGQFPEKYDALLKLPGIGPYTAAAIASFAFGQPSAVVDGNVFRVLARIFGINKDIASASGQKYFRKIANDLIDPDNPGEYNQAIMEFGALCCTPANPHCPECIFNDTCQARINKVQGKLPVKSKKTRVRKRFLNYAVFKTDKGLYMKPRTEKDIWQGLYDFPVVETAAEMEEEEGLNDIYALFNVQSPGIPESVSPVYIHQLSHQKLSARFYLINFGMFEPVFKDASIRLFSHEEIHDLPKPVLISRYLNDYIF